MLALSAFVRVLLEPPYEGAVEAAEVVGTRLVGTVTPEVDWLALIVSTASETEVPVLDPP